MYCIEQPLTRDVNATRGMLPSTSTLAKIGKQAFYFHKPLWCEVMLKTRVRLPALTYGINKLISLANIRKYRNILYRYSHGEAEKATPALRIRKVSTSERFSQIISLPRRGHEHKPTIHRRQKQTIQRTDVLSHKTVAQNNWGRQENSDDCHTISSHVRVWKKNKIQTVQSWYRFKNLN